MPHRDRAKQMAARVAKLNATDHEFAAARTELKVCAAIAAPEARLANVMRIVADRPAMGQRAVELLTDSRRPQSPRGGGFMSVDRFLDAVQKNMVGSDHDIPHMSLPLIVKYVTSLQKLGLL